MSVTELTYTATSIWIIMCNLNLQKEQVALVVGCLFLLV